MKDNTCLCQCVAITVLVAKALRIEVDLIFKISEKYLSEGVIDPSIKHQLEKESERVLHVFRENNLVGQAQLLASKYITRSPNMAVIYLYTDRGDLVHCNNCDADMLVPTGADKCPYCYYEGRLQWHDENNQESTVSQLDYNPNYVLVTKNAPESSEYLCDETLKNEFNIEPNPNHKYKRQMKKNHNKASEKQPTGQCTVQELAHRLLSLNTGEELNFSENPDGSDYWGAKYLEVFEQHIIIFGYYGGPYIQLYETEKDVLSDMVRHLCYHLNKKEEEIIYTFDVAKQETNTSSKENIVSSFFFYMWNGWCKEECKIVFGWEFQHFWDKWCEMCKIYKVYSAAEKFYADLTEHNRVKLVNRACELYDGRARRKLLPE